MTLLREIRGEIKAVHLMNPFFGWPILNEILSIFRLFSNDQDLMLPGSCQLLVSKINLQIPSHSKTFPAMDSSQPSLRTLILAAAKHLSLEWQNDRIRLQLPSDPPLDRCHSGPFARALRRYIPEIQVEEWDAACCDTGRQPMVYSMEKGLLSKYVHWARCLGVAEENLALPPWLTPLTAPDALSRGQTQPVEPSFFSEPQARNLAEYQKRAIRFGISISGKVLLADDLGLGKSIQALGVAWQYRETFPLLILCPPVQRNVWQQEIAKWTPIPVTEVQEVLTETTVLETTARVVIVSYACLGKFEELQSSAEIRFKVVIADECHSIKHFDAYKSKVILRIASLAQRLILISSDNLVKTSAAELHPLFQNLDPYLGTEETFLRRYFVGKLGKLGWRIDPRREQELEAYLFKVIGIRRKTAEVSSELLPLRRQRIFLPKSGCSLSMGDLKRMETEMFHRQRFVSDSGSKQARLSEMKRVSHLVMQTKRQSCVEYVTHITNNGGKMLLFAYHRDMLDSLEAALKETLGASGYVRIDQQTPTHERENLVTCFEDDECHTALLSFTALSEGQSLPHVEAVVFAELAWAPSIILQCEARAHGIHGIHKIHEAGMGRKGSSRSSHSILIQYLLLEDCQWDSHCYERLEEKLRHVTLGTGDAAEEHDAASISRFIEAPPAAPSSQQEIHDSFPQREVTQEGLHDGRSDELYQVVEHLHLGLNLKLQQCYTKDSLEKKCKGNEQKLRRLRYFMKEAKKLHPVAAFKPGGVGAGAQMVHPPKRQKLSE